jgi:hypothetical protein
MASTSRRFDSRTSATTNATSNRGTSNRGTARTQALIAAEKAKAQAALDAAEKEKATRTAPITGTLAGYDATVGAFLFTTPDGGTIRASLAGGTIPTALQTPIQRTPGSQSCTVATPPANTGGNVLSQIEAAQRSVVDLLSTEALDFRIDVPEATTYTLSAYQHYAVRIEALEGVSGATVATSPAIGATASVGDAISITVSGLPDPVVPVVGSILLRRV